MKSPSTNANVVQQFLHELGAKNVNAVNPDGDTALMVASYMGDIECVDVLHELKANLNVCTKAGTAIYRAALAGKTRMLKVIPRQPKLV